MERKDIDKKYKWDLSVIYESVDAFNEDFAAVEKRIKDFKRHEKLMTGSGKALYEALDEITSIENNLMLLWEYASLNFSTDSTSTQNQALSARVRSLANVMGEASWFVSPKILTLDEKILAEFKAECPELARFDRMIFKIMRGKPYTLSDESEALLSKIEDSFGSHSRIRSMFTTADLHFGKIKDGEGKTVELTDTNYVNFLLSKDRAVRQRAFRTLYKTYEQFGNTFASLYESRIKEAVVQAKVRGFKNSITASTFSDEVTPSIYNNLIKTVRGGLKPLYDYYEIKRQMLGVDKLHLYDVYTPLLGELNVEYTYEQAVEEVLKTTEIYGKEYHDALKAGLTEKGWVDVYPSHGKRGGAFSSGCHGTEPYILTNFNGHYNDVSTLAHEAGHSMHTWFSNKYNEAHNANYTIFVAEVASTVNELLLAHRKLRECESDDEKLYILNQLMETYKGTIYRQTMFAEFERDMHALCEKGEPLTAEKMNKCYYKLVKKYFGPDVAVDKQIAYEWMRIPHFFSCFYVYKYSTCICAAAAIVKRIEEEGEGYINQYIDFLKCGGSKSPLESLLVAGIDMNSPEVIQNGIDEFASVVEQFKTILNSKSCK